MTIKEHLSQSAQYNYWANQSMIEWILEPINKNQ